MKKLIYISLIILSLGCKKKPVYESKATKQCKNFELFVSRLFPKETIRLYYNEKLILEQQIDSLDGFRFKREFCINYNKKGTFKVQSIFKDKVYIDTTITVNKSKYGYTLAFGFPRPKKWKEYFTNNSPIPTKEYGFLPIDSCVRLASLMSDTVFKNTWTDQVR